MANNLIVDEEYIRQESSNIRDALLTIDSGIRMYQGLLQVVMAYGIKSGATKDALKAFSEAVAELKGDMKLAGENVKQLMDNYLMAIDDADKYIF